MSSELQQAKYRLDLARTGLIRASTSCSTDQDYGIRVATWQRTYDACLLQVQELSLLETIDPATAANH